MRSWCLITSAMMKFSNFSANAGSSLAFSARVRSRAICRASRAGSAGGSWWTALRWPTCWVALKRSASMWTTAASMLSMLSRSRSSSSRTTGSTSPVPVLLVVMGVNPTKGRRGRPRQWIVGDPVVPAAGQPDRRESADTRIEWKGVQGVFGGTDVANGGPVEHGYPHLETVRAAITALYRRLSYDTVQTFSTSVVPADVAFCDTDDLHLGAQRVAREMVRHFRLPEARMIVGFREMTHAANVEL